MTRFATAALVFVFAATMGAVAHADSRLHHPVQVTFESCSSAEESEVLRIASIETRQAIAPLAVPVDSALRVQAICVDDGVRILVRSDGGALLVTRMIALSQADTPGRPRVIALAITEALVLGEANLNDSPPVAAAAPDRDILLPKPPDRKLDPFSGRRVSLELAGGARAWFAGSPGTTADLLAGGRVAWEAAPPFAFSAGILFEEGSTTEPLGHVRKRGVSGSASIEIFTESGRARFATGIMATGGTAQMTGVPDDSAVSRGGSVTGTWLGAALLGSFRMLVGNSVAVRCGLEAGFSPVGIQGQVDQTSHLAWRGPWLGALLGVGQVF